MPISNSGQFDEVDESSWVAGTMSVTNSASEAKVGASRLAGRQSLLVYNGTNVNIYYGPSGVTTTNGIPIFPQQQLTLSIGNLGVYLIAAAAGPYTVIVHEVG